MFKVINQKLNILLEFIKNRDNIPFQMLSNNMRRNLNDNDYGFIKSCFN